MSPEKAKVTRRARRIPSKRTTKVICYKGAFGIGTNLARSLLDISTDGARLVVTVALDKGQDVLLQLEAPWQHRPIKAAGKVVWCMATDAGTHCIGVAFEKTLPYIDLQAVAQC
jgi:Tfp pilus assembly protein PilZ